jgi:site-specific DNA recombinase
MKSAVIYCRVSSADQIDNTSLTTQEEACRHWCARNGYQVARVFQDRGESAKTADRPQFIAMIDHCQKTRSIERLIVYKTDRFARSSLDYAVFRHKLRESGTVVVSASEPVSDDASGKLFEMILAGFAEFDNSVRAARAKLAMKAVQTAGGWCHKAPFGFRIDRRPDGLPELVPDPETAGQIREAYRAVSAGMSPQAAYEKTRPNCCRSTFYRTLRDPMYAKIDNQAFAAVQTAMGKTPARRKRIGDFPLKGTLICADCKKPLTASTAKGKYDYYHCRIPGHNARIAPDAINAAVAELLSSISGAMVAQMDFFRRLIDQESHAETAAAVIRHEDAMHRITDLQAQKDRLVDAMIAGRIDPATFDRKQKQIDRDLVAAQAAEQDAGIQITDAEAIIQEANDTLTDLPAMWNRLKPADRCRLLAAIFPRGLEVAAGTLRTSATDSVFGELCRQSAGQCTMAPPTGWLSNLAAALMQIRQVAA